MTTDMNDIKISVIIPVYNVKQYITRCVESVLQQNFSKYEILLIDDGSTDGSDAICDDYNQKYDCITAFHKKNGGLSDARNFGLKKANGRYILFVDSDDYLAENALNALYGETSERPDMVIGHCMPLKPSKNMDRFENVVRRNLEYHHIYTGKKYLELCLKGGAIRVEAWRSLYLREFLLKNNLEFKRNIMHEDEQFTPRALLLANKIVLSDLEFYCYDNTRESSIMNSPSLSTKKAIDRFEICDELISIYKNVKPHILKRLLLDDISWKYIDCFCTYCQNEALVKPKRLDLVFMAYKFKRKIKAVLFAISPSAFVRFQAKHK